MIYINLLQRSCQTLPLHTAEAEAQVLHVLDSGTQTETQDGFAEYHEVSSDHPGLKEFLGAVEEVIIKELIKNSRSHAFDGFEVNWVDHNETVRVHFWTWLNSQTTLACLLTNNAFRVIR